VVQFLELGRPDVKAAHDRSAPEDPNSPNVTKKGLNKTLQERYATPALDVGALELIL
jgi:hypothetical protein